MILRSSSSHLREPSISSSLPPLPPSSALSSSTSSVTVRQFQVTSGRHHRITLISLTSCSAWKTHTSRFSGSTSCSCRTGFSTVCISHQEDGLCRLVDMFRSFPADAPAPTSARTLMPATRWYPFCWHPRTFCHRSTSASFLLSTSQGRGYHGQAFSLRLESEPSMPRIFYRPV